MGPADAPVTIVEWSDYQCPFCKRAHPTVQQVLSEYKDKVRFIYLDYPLPFHQMAMPASQAVHCAEDQGKFWEYHTNLFEAAGDLSKADLSKRATDLGLDSAAFEACTTANKRDELDQDELRRRGRVGRDRNSGLLHQRPHARRRPADRAVPRRHQRRAFAQGRGRSEAWNRHELIQAIRENMTPPHRRGGVFLAQPRPLDDDRWKLPP